MNQRRTPLLSLGLVFSAASLFGAYEWTVPDYEGLVSRRIPHTALLGNGDVGVTSGGNEFHKEFWFSKGDFWGYLDSPAPIGGVSIGPQKDEDRSGMSLSRGATAKAKTVHERFSPDRAVNGKAEGAYEGWVSAIGNPQWLELDLQAAKSFDRFVVRHSSAFGSHPSTVTRAFTLSVKTKQDDSWRKIYETSDNDRPVTDVTLGERVTARFVRLDVTQGTQETTDDSRRNPRARICQVELYDSALDDSALRAKLAKPTKRFHEVQDIERARILTEMELDGAPVAMDTRLMADENILVTKLTSKAGNDVPLRVRLWSRNENGWRATASAWDECASVARELPRSRKDDPRSFTTRAALAVRVLGAAVSGTNAADSSSEILFTLPAGKSVVVLTAVGGGGRTFDHLGRLAGSDPTDEAKALLDKASDKTRLAALVKGHADWWKAFYAASSVSLDASDDRLKTIQEYYDHSRYMLGSSLRGDKVASGLYGIWHTHDHPAWHSDYHLNYNFIASYYGVATMNHPELLLPAVKAIEEFLPYGASDAAAFARFSDKRPFVQEFLERKFKDGSIDREKGISGGVLFPVGIGPWGMTLDRSYHNQTVNASFCVVPFVQYYEATRDEQFLRERLYPLVKPVLAFLSKWVVEEPKGVYTIYAGVNEGSWAKNSVGEIGMYRLCLKYAIMASEKFRVDPELRAAWKELDAKLAPYSTIEVDGREVVAMCTEIYRGGAWAKYADAPNRLTLEPVFPGFGFGYFSPPEVIRLWQDTIRPVDRANTWWQINAFPELYTQALMLRYEPEHVVTKLAETIRRIRQANGTLDDTCHGLEKAGAAEAVHSMLVQSHKGVVKAFPSWLADRSASFRDLRVPGAFLVSGAYDGATRRVSELSVTSTAGGTLTVVCPWPETKVVATNPSSPNVRPVAAKLATAPDHPEERTIAFETQAGETYRFLPLRK